MILAAALLAGELTRCAPAIVARTMTAIVHVESGGDPFAIGDNTARRAYHPRSAGAARLLAGRLLRAGHSLDLGIAQIDVVNLARLGLNLQNVFDPCANLAAGATILSEDYALAARRFGIGQLALRRAIGMYNTGRLDAGFDYTRRVLAAAGVQWKARALVARNVEADARKASFIISVVLTRRSAAAYDPRRAPILVTLHPANLGASP